MAIQRIYRRRIVRRSRSAMSCRFVHLLAWASGGADLSARIPFGPLHGRRLYMATDDHPALALGLYERHVLRALSEHTAPGAVAYDIGANVGYISLALARMVGESGRVFSFEPAPATFRLLQRNISCNGVANVRPCNVALSDSSGTVSFATFTYSLVNHIATERTPADATIVAVESRTLDDLVYGDGDPAPAIIKIDVEGADEQVFKGAHRLLADMRPVVVAEIRVHLWDAITAQMRQNGYRWSILGDADSLTRRSIADVLFTPTR